MIYLVPIEPLTERYTESWYRNIPSLVDNYTIIDGAPLLDDDIAVGTFLDINSTINYKNVQMQKIASLFHTQKVKDGDKFFFYDMEFWGLESLRLMAQMNHVDIKIYAFLHAASYTEGDAIEVASYYQKYTEIGWFYAVDKIFVGSDYHKRIFWDRRIKHSGCTYAEYDNKVIVTTNPIFANDYQKQGLQKQKLVLLCNRLDKEKRPLDTLHLFEKLKQRYPDWTFRVCTSRKALRSNDQSIIDFALSLQERGIIDIKYGLTKAEYHAQLEQAMFTVSHSREESFGICIAESLVYGAVPFLFNGASHPEFVKYGAIVFEPHNDYELMCDVIDNYFRFNNISYDCNKGINAIAMQLKD